MKALVFTADRTPTVMEVPDPVMAPNEVLVAVEAIGVCHTDLEILRGNYPAALPVIPGHEFAGRLIDVGNQVEGLKAGDRVAIDPLVTCGSCRNCSTGHPNLCKAIQAYGAELNGGMAEYVSVRAGNAYSVGDLDPAIAAIAEPLACALHGIDRVQPSPRDRALIFGAGPIGILLAIGLRARGIYDIGMVDVFQNRLDTATKFGASHTVLADETERLSEHDYDLVIDATGRPSVVQAALKFLRDAGTLLNFGVCPPGSEVIVDPYEIYSRELRIIGSFSLATNLASSIEALTTTTLPIEDLITHRVPLVDAADALTTVGRSDSLKVQVTV